MQRASNLALNGTIKNCHCQADRWQTIKDFEFFIPNKTMSTIKYDGRCAKCGRGPVATGIPVFRDLEAEGTGKSGTEAVVFCIDCVRRLLHQEGEDEVVAGG
jgi:hypothetical protein